MAKPLECFRGLRAWIFGLLSISLMWGMASEPVRAQLKPIHKLPVTIRGSVGTYGEAYSIQGREARRPSSTTRLFIRPTVTVMGMDFPFEITVSSEETSFRQPFNRFGISPSWRWITVHAGDFYPRFSRFTLGGITVRGGGIDLRPGIFRLSVAVGRSQRAVTSGLGNDTYERNLWAIKFGLGKERGNFLDINVLRVMDDTTSVQDSFDVAPQENLVVEIDGRLRLFKNRFSLRWKAAGSVHTRDMRSSEFKDADIPDFVRNMYTPRLSTKADYIYQVETGIKLSRGSVQVGYGHIGPGFISLGTGSTVNDRRKISIKSNVKIIKRKLTFRGRYTQYRDNLEGQKRNTTTRESTALSFNIRPVQAVGFTVGHSRNTMGNDSKNDTTRVDTYNGRYTFNGRFSFEVFGISHALQSSYNFQKSERRNPLRAQKGFDVRNFTMGLSSQVWTGFSVGANFGVTSNKMADETSLNTCLYGLSLSHRAWERQLSNSVRMTLQSTGDYRSLGFNLSTRLNLTRSDSFVLNIRRTDYSHEIDPERNFQEMTASLSFDHRF